MLIKTKFTPKYNHIFKNCVYTRSFKCGICKYFIQIWIQKFSYLFIILSFSSSIRRKTDQWTHQPKNPIKQSMLMDTRIFWNYWRIFFSPDNLVCLDYVQFRISYILKLILREKPALGFLRSTIFIIRLNMFNAFNKF